MSNVFANRVLVSTATTGTGTITLGAGLAGYRSFGGAGIANGSIVRYLIIDGNNWEIGTGTYTSSGTTLSRTVQESSAGGTTAISLSGGARVGVIAAAQDYSAFVKGPASATGDHLALFDGATGKLIKGGGIRGTAANATLTTSTTDTTAGRVTRVGDFGIGGVGVSLTGGTNLKDRALAGGFYSFVGVDTPGGPENLSFRYSLLVIHGSADGRRQFLCWRDQSPSGPPLVWFGHQETNASGNINWALVVHLQNLLGTVSQSGGVPTGAVIQRGSNANGEFVRFADGTLICTHTLTSDTAADVTWTFPSVFSAAPRVGGSARLTGPRIYNPSTISTTTMTFSVWNLSSSRSATSTDLIAIGRWF